MSASGLQIVIVVEVLIVFIGEDGFGSLAQLTRVGDGMIFDKVVSVGRRHGTPK